MKLKLEAEISEHQKLFNEMLKLPSQYLLPRTFSPSVSSHQDFLSRFGIFLVYGTVKVIPASGYSSILLNFLHRDNLFDGAKKCWITSCLKHSQPSMVFRKLLVATGGRLGVRELGSSVFCNYYRFFNFNLIAT